MEDRRRQDEARHATAQRLSALGSKLAAWPPIDRARMATKVGAVVVDMDAAESEARCRRELAVLKRALAFAFPPWSPIRDV